MHYFFDHFNNTSVPVKYLFIVPEDICLAAAPSILTVNPVLAPGETRNFPTLLQVSGPCPANEGKRQVEMVS